MASRPTKYDLEHVTDYIEFESFCHDLMSREGFKDIEPLGGSKDKGRDAIHISKVSGKTTIFTYSVRDDLVKKLYEDLSKIQKYEHRCDFVVYVTTGSPTASDKDALKQHVASEFKWKLEIYDLERIGTLIDNHYQVLKQLHPAIFRFSSQALPAEILNRGLYADYLLQAYDEWLKGYTPLLAEHREIETFVIPSGSNHASLAGIPVAKIPEVAQIAIVLGESGAGKTTALWRVVVEYSKALKEGTSTIVPVLISLRGWSIDFRCRDLAQQDFAFAGASRESIERELRSGNCLILIDGLNELPPSGDIRDEAHKDIQRFLVDYALNRFVICCRTSDYEPRLLDLEQLKPKLPPPEVFEIRRLDRAQLTDYVRRYFNETPAEGDQLLARLGVDTEALWSDKTSILHLARIPLYLQLIVGEYRRSKQLPDNISRLLRTLIYSTLQREDARRAGQVDRFAKERLLGSFAYRAIREGYSLRLPDQRAQSITLKESQLLKQEGLIRADLTFGAIWQEVLSNNFLRVVDWLWVEWLHQLILDYFLACEIARIRTDMDVAEIRELNRTISGSLWEQACVVAMGLIIPNCGGMFLEDLTRIDARIARKAFESQSEDERQQLSESLIAGITYDVDDTENGRLIQVAVALPYLSIVQTLFACFRSSADAVRERVAEAVSLMVIRYYPRVAEGSPYGRWLNTTSEDDQSLDDATLSQAVKRGIQLLTTWIGNNNDVVRYHAAKGLWETDKGQAAQILRGLILTGDDSVKARVKDLMEQWGIS